LRRRTNPNIPAADRWGSFLAATYRAPSTITTHLHLDVVLKDRGVFGKQV